MPLSADSSPADLLWRLSRMVPGELTSVVLSVRRDAARAPWKQLEPEIDALTEKFLAWMKDSAHPRTIDAREGRGLARTPTTQSG